MSTELKHLRDWKIYIVKENLNEDEFLMVNQSDPTDTHIVKKSIFKVSREKIHPELEQTPYHHRKSQNKVLPSPVR
jgi:hypothetical protein